MATKKLTYLDHGFNVKTTTGTIKKGKSLLILDHAIGIKPGDIINVWPSGRFTIGPDGAFPYKIFKDEKEMRADETQEPGTWASFPGSKETFRFNTTWWSIGKDPFAGLVPFAAERKVIKTTSAGKYLYLDQSVVVDCIKAKVTVDNSQPLKNYVINVNSTFDAKQLGLKPTDTLYIGRVKWEGKIWRDKKQDWWTAENVTIDGGGITFDSVPGKFPASIGLEQGNGDGNFSVKNCTIKQNGNMAIYGVGRQDTDGIPGLPMKNEPFGNPFLYMPAVGGWCKKCKAENVNVLFPNGYGFEGNLELDNCKIIFDKDGNKKYTSWPFHVPVVRNSSFYSPFLVRGIEIPNTATNGGTVENFTSTNGTFANNAAANTKWKKVAVVLEENCADENRSMIENPLFDFNNRLGFGDNRDVITVEDCTITYKGYITSDRHLLRDFVMNDVAGVTLANVDITKPQAAKAGNGEGAIIQYGGDNLTLKNWKINGGKYGYPPEDQGRDAAQFDLRGKATVIENVVGAECIICREDTVLKGDNEIQVIKRVD